MDLFQYQSNPFFCHLLDEKLINLSFTKIFYDHKSLQHQKIKQFVKIEATISILSSPVANKFPIICALFKTNDR